jgi:death-on-curing protein
MPTIMGYVAILSPASTIRIGDCDRGRLDACLAAPRAGFGGIDKYPDIASKAAALLYALAKGHACKTGNKRLAYVVTIVFLTKNDWFLWENPDVVSSKVEEVAASDPKNPDDVRIELTTWIQDRLIAPEEAAVRLQAKLSPGQQ